MPIAKQLNEERAAIERKRREREEQHLYLAVGVITEENFKAHQGFDLADWEIDPLSPAAPQTHRILRTWTVAEFARSLAEKQNIHPDHVRLWVMVNRQNKTTRPDQPILDTSMTMDEAFNKHGTRDKSFRLWLETASTIEDGKAIWPDIQSNSNPPLLVFLKYFDAVAQSLLGIGHVYVRKNSKVAELIPIALQLMGWAPGSSSITLYEVCLLSDHFSVYIALAKTGVGDKAFNDRTNEAKSITSSSGNSGWGYRMFSASSG